jgi:hypothetical protein
MEIPISMDFRGSWLSFISYFYIHIIKYFKKFLNVEKTLISLI